MSRSVAAQTREILAALRRHGTRRNIEGMARFGIVSKKAFGVSVETIRTIAARYERSPALAVSLWKSGWHESRTMAAFLHLPARVTPAQMDRWCRDFDNWAVCDTICFHLWDRTPHAFRKVRQWARRGEEFVKRAAFALLASLALHDREAKDVYFRRCLPLIEKAATDERNFVKKGVSWALRGLGQRSHELHADAVRLATRLANAESASARWIGRDALRDLSSPAAKKRMKTRPRRR